MRIFFLFLLVISLQRQGFAICAADYVGVSPHKGNITRNPVFLLEYNEDDFKLANRLDDLEFYLLVNKKRKVKVDILEKVTGLGSYSQLLLKPNVLLHLNDSVQLQVISKTARPERIDLQFNKFQNRVNRRKWVWVVNLKRDREPVTWSGNIVTDLQDQRHDYRIKFYYEVTENNPVVYEYGQGLKAEMQLFEVVINGQKFFCIGGGKKPYFGIYEGECGSNYWLQRNKDYEVTVTALDFSGNRSPEVQKVSFNIRRSGVR